MKPEADKVDQQEQFQDIARKAEKQHEENANLAEQMEALSGLAVLMNTFGRLLDDLDDLVAKGPAKRLQWFKADKPVIGLRRYLNRHLVQSAAAHNCEGSDIGNARRKLVEEPKAGQELIHACKLMAVYILAYLWAEMVGVASMTTSLATEGRDCILDEMAREILPSAGSNLFLAQLRLSLLDDDSVNRSDEEVDERSDDTERKAVARRRARIDEMVVPLAATLRRDLGALVEAQLATRCSAPERVALLSLRKRIEEIDDKDVRTYAKRWLNLQMMFLRLG
jgi:hypothetical protein